MRIITLCLVLLIVSGCYDRLSAQDYKVAIGIRFSTSPPTLSNSFSVKYFIDSTNASKASSPLAPVSVWGDCTNATN